jgi:hypothetical protein
MHRGLGCLATRSDFIAEGIRDGLGKVQGRTVDNPITLQRHGTTQLGPSAQDPNLRRAGQKHIIL